MKNFVSCRVRRVSVHRVVPTSMRRPTLSNFAPGKSPPRELNTDPARTEWLKDFG